MWTAKNFEEKMTPYIDAIYEEHFKGRLLEIQRSSRENSDSKTLFMDIHLSIDTHLRFKDGTVLTFQEKTRRNLYSKFNEFTFEYYNDPKILDEGEWFKLASQLYFYGYANEKEDGYSQYWILNVAKLRTGLMSKFDIKQLESRFLKHNKPPAKANFFAIPFTTLEDMPGVVSFKS